MDLVFLNHVLDVFLLEILVPDDEYLSISLGHGQKGIFRVKGLENPAVAVGRGNNSRLEGDKQLSQGSQLAPNGHSLPVDTEFLSLHSSFIIGDSLFQLLEKHFVIINRLGRASQNNSRPHMNSGIKEAHGRRHSGVCFQDFFPERCTFF